ncbi:hypothetical protein EU523_01430 [Candidatus Heimdallarchaeota archaeon]|nr:MAG: hypothetical protein EU523_01430 [Candidatus Heimdallarchaeota archaeon]
MSDKKVDSGTLVLDQKGAELGVIKKVYSPNLARLELQNSESIAINPQLITDIETTGRLIKKSQGTIKPEATTFFKGAKDTLEKIAFNGISLLYPKIVEEETKRALQLFEFEFLTKAELSNELPLLEAIGFVRGLELAAKTPQDFVVKMVFQATEAMPELKEIIAPEIVVDRLNQEKAFPRFLWNIQRIGVSQSLKIKDENLIIACSESILELGLKVVDIEYREDSSKDILYWRKRLRDCILNYIKLMIRNISLEKQQPLLNEIKPLLKGKLNDIKIKSQLEDEFQNLLEDFSITKPKKINPSEFLHSGIIGFDLARLKEDLVMKELHQITMEHFDQGKKSVGRLQQKIEQVIRDTRDVSKDFVDLLFEISHYLKKIEYGDSKVREQYSKLMNETNKKKYTLLHSLVKEVSKEFLD